MQASHMKLLILPVMVPVIFDNTSIGDSSTIYQWNMGDGTIYNTSTPDSIIHVYPYPDSFEVTLIATNILTGCADTFQISVFSGDFYNLSIPNAFLPASGFQDRDIFKAVGVGLKEFKLNIYTPWGDLIWSTDSLHNTSPAEEWDGTINGVRVNTDSFIWQVEKAVFVDGKQWEGMVYRRAEKPRRMGTLLILR